MENVRNKKLLSIIGVFLVIMMVVGVTYAFFNYTRTGLANNIGTGRIYFNSTQNGKLQLTNIFPVKASEVDANSLDSVSVSIFGDTTYQSGEEYLISLVNVNNTINDKQIPINYIATYTANTDAVIGSSSGDYWNAREDKNANIYLLNENGSVVENKQVLVGFIKNDNTGINGTLTIKAYVDADRIAISDTYDGSEDDNHGTTTNWVGERTVLTTEEWNSMQSTPISFQIRAESNEGVWVEEPLTGEKMVRRAITAKINAETNACNPIWIDDMGTTEDETDDITYFSGTKTCVDMNYVWYSGKLWRITAIYPDGAMKLVTQNNITSIAFNEDSQLNFYTDENTTSYMYQWLNEDFYDTLYNASEFIDTTKLWNATNSNASSIDAISTRLPETTLVNANVGLLNSYEYYNSYRCVGSTACTGSSYSTGYLNMGYHWWLLNPYNSSWAVWFVYNYGAGNYYIPTYSSGGRPSIYLKSGLEFTGNGTIDSPYKIVGDKDSGSENDLINTRISGEYVKLKNGNNEQTFRIIGVEDNKTKIIAMDYADNKGTRKFATSTGSANTLWGSGETTGTDTWYTYLNDTYYPNLVSIYGNLFDSSTYYLGTSGYNYKLSVCANTTSGSIKNCIENSQVGTHDTFNIGLPRYGEMFATQQGAGSSSSIHMWLMNRYGALSVWYVYNDGHGGINNPTGTNGGRPTLHLKSTVKIIEGSGTESDPYVVGL